MKILKVFMSIIFIIVIIVIFRTCSNNSKIKNIERVLHADNAASLNVKKASTIVKNMESIDLSGCPTDFKQAYIRYIGAWIEIALCQERERIFDDKYNSLAGGIEAFARGLTFDLGILKEANQERQIILQRYDKAANNVKNKFEKVQIIALEYGATLPN